MLYENMKIAGENEEHIKSQYTWINIVQNSYCYVFKLFVELKYMTTEKWYYQDGRAGHPSLCLPPENNNEQSTNNNSSGSI